MSTSPRDTPVRGKYSRPGKLDMVNHQTGKSTTLLFKDWKFKVGLKDRDFDQNSLQSAR